MTESGIIKRRKKVSKRNKKSWIKHVNNKDVEDFLDLKRLEERLGGPFKEKKDEELFIVDDTAHLDKLKPKLTRKERAKLPLKCYQNLRNDSSIPDPIVKRNRVKTKEERKCRIRKNIEKAKLEKGIVPLKILQAQKDRAFTQRRKNLAVKELDFEKDIWDNNSGECIFGCNVDTSWINDETMKHHASDALCSLPKGKKKKISVIPAIETPHPGVSYNPSLKHHQELLEKVVEQEMNKLKEEAHISRVTSDMFKKVTVVEKEAQWIEEMSQGLVKEETEEGDVQAGPLSINPPTSFMNKKTLKQRRKQKEQKEFALARKHAKIEKKKTSDIYKLKFIKSDIQNKEDHEKFEQEKREKQNDENAGKTRRLAAKKFIEPDLVFNQQNELHGSLRLLNKSGSLLSDRFYSFQKRNILAPSTKVTRFRKAKVKKFLKASHRIEGVNFFTFRTKKNKCKRNKRS